MSVSSSSVTVGDTVTVTISISCDGGSMASLRLNYNSSYMTLTDYPSSDFNPSTGMLLIDASDSNSASRTFKFRTGGVGSTTISLTVVEFYGMTDSNVTGYSSQLSKTITVKQKSSGGGGGGGGGGGSSTPSKSTDASLSSITINEGALEPGFARDVYDYKIYLGKGIEKIDVKTSVSNSKSTVGSYKTDLVAGWNKIEIPVTAEAGNKRTYTLNVYVEEEPDKFFEYNGKNYGVVKNLDKVTAYEGFTTSTLKVDEETEVTIYDHDAYHLIYLEDEEGNKDFYQFNKIKKQILGTYQELEIAGKRYVTTDVDLAQYPQMDDRFHRDEVEISEGVTVQGWKYNDTSMREFTILPLATNNGIYILYRYDAKEKTLQRYLEPKEEVVEEPPVLDPHIGVACGVGGAVALLFAVILTIRSRKR